MGKQITDKHQGVTPENLPETTPQKYTIPDQSFTLQAIMEIQKAIGQLTQAVVTLAGQTAKNCEKLDNISHNFYASQMEEMRKMIQSMISSQSNPAVSIRELSHTEAKEEISQYFRKHDGEEIGYDDLIENLGIEPNLVIQICHELEKEGKIG